MTGMVGEPEERPRDDDAAQAHEAAARQAAQDGAAELARMGIDPRALGLEPVPPPGSGGTPSPGRPARGVATPPAGARSSPANGQPAPPTSAPPVSPVSPVLPAQPSRPAPPAAQPSGPAPPAAPEPSWLDSTLSRPIAPVAPPPPAPGDPAGLLDRLVPAPVPAPSGGWRRVVRVVTRGLLEPSAAAAVEYERQLVNRVRVRRPEPRVVAFLAGKGGVGTSTTAAGVALTLVSLRADSTALVCGRSGTGSLGQRLLGQPAPPVPALAGGDPAPPPLWVYQRLAVVDGAPWHSPTSRDALVGLLERLRGQHPHTIVDIGNDLDEPAAAALHRADQIVLVTSASQDAVAAARTALSRVHQIDPFRLATVVVAVVSLSEQQYRRTSQRLHAALGMLPARVVPVGFDPWLAAGDRLDPAQLRATTRQAYLRIAGLLVDPGQTGQWFSQPSGTVPRHE